MEEQNQPTRKTMRFKMEKQEEDRISDLPDGLLIDIISRLDRTKVAVRTGTLSKRWQNLWTEVHNLNFTYVTVTGISRFVLGIENVLRQRGQLDLNKFQLHTPYSEIDDKQVNGWIRYAFSCNVKDLDLELTSGSETDLSEFLLDQFFFINSSITHMKLNGCIIKPSGAISWPNLKSLCIVWGNIDQDLINNICSGSPLLESLKLELCQGFLRIDITSKSVKRLVFAGYSDEWYELHDAVEINAPHILSLTIEEELMVRKVVLLNVSSLVEAELNYFMHERHELRSKDEKEELLKGLIQSLQHVKNLKIGNKCQKTLARLKAKGFTFPSNMEHRPDYGPSESEDWYATDSTESGDSSDKDSTESEDSSEKDSTESEDSSDKVSTESEDLSDKDSTESEDLTDQDSTESEDWSDKDSTESGD